MGESKQKGSLASLAQKKKCVPKLKTILSQPFPKYMPKIQFDDIKDLKELILDDKNEYNKANYKKYRGLIIGLNSILRLLKNNKISCLLLSTGIKPFSIVHQIITFALTTGQPAPYILCVPNLNEILRELFQIESFALACKRDKFTKLEEYMKVKCLQFPISEKFLIYHGYKQNEKPEIFNKTTKVKHFDEEVNFNELYVLKTHAISSRSFYPNNAKYLKPLKFEESKEFVGDYISLSHDENNAEKFVKYETTDYKTDKQNLVSIIKNHFANTKENILKTESQSQEKLCQKRKKTNLINKTSKIEYEQLKIKKIQGNPKKKAERIKLKSK